MWNDEGVRKQFVCKWNVDAMCPILVHCLLTLKTTFDLEPWSLAPYFNLLSFVWRIIVYILSHLVW